jgi:uncharacterized membrane protein
VHFAVVHAQSEPIRVALMLVPLLALAYWIVTRSRHKLLWSFLLLAAGAAICLLEYRERWGLAAAYGLPHAAVYLLLLSFFGETLRRGREPLITRLARRVHGTLPPAMEAYTRRLTIAWCVFCGLQVAVSLLLLSFAPLDIWSLFVNVLNFPLLALMFVVEYAYRVTRHRNFPHASLLKSIQAFAQHAAVSKNAQAR